MIFLFNWVIFRFQPLIFRGVSLNKLLHKNLVNLTFQVYTFQTLEDVPNLMEGEWLVAVKMWPTVSPVVRLRQGGMFLGKAYYFTNLSLHSLKLT